MNPQMELTVGFSLENLKISPGVVYKELRRRRNEKRPVCFDGGPFKTMPFVFSQSSSKESMSFLGAENPKLVRGNRENDKTAEQDEDLVTISISNPTPLRASLKTKTKPASLFKC